MTDSTLTIDALQAVDLEVIRMRTDTVNPRRLVRVLIPNYLSAMFPVCGQVLKQAMEVVFISFLLGGALKYVCSVYYVLQEISDHLPFDDFSGFSLL